MKFARACVLALGLALASATPALACSCSRPPASSLWENAGAAFIGIARGTRPVGNGESVTTFEVTEELKGVQYGETVAIRHPSGSSASCGVQFAPGSTHTLAAFSRDGALSTNLCSIIRDGTLLEELRQLRDDEIENDDQ